MLFWVIFFIFCCILSFGFIVFSNLSKILFIVSMIISVVYGTGFSIKSYNTIKENKRYWLILPITIFWIYSIFILFILNTIVCFSRYCNGEWIGDSMTQILPIILQGISFLVLTIALNIACDSKHRYTYSIFSTIFALVYIIISILLPYNFSEKIYYEEYSEIYAGTCVIKSDINSIKEYVSTGTNSYYSGFLMTLFLNGFNEGETVYATGETYDNYVEVYNDTTIGYVLSDDLIRTTPYIEETKLVTYEGGRCFVSLHECNGERVDTKNAIIVSEDNNIATVNEDGDIVGVGVGDTKVTITYNGCVFICDIHVNSK